MSENTPGENILFRMPEKMFTVAVKVRTLLQMYEEARMSCVDFETRREMFRQMGMLAQVKELNMHIEKQKVAVDKTISMMAALLDLPDVVLPEETKVAHAGAETLIFTPPGVAE